MNTVLGLGFWVLGEDAAILVSAAYMVGGIVAIFALVGRLKASPAQFIAVVGLWPIAMPLWALWASCRALARYFGLGRRKPPTDFNVKFRGAYAPRAVDLCAKGTQVFDRVVDVIHRKFANVAGYFPSSVEHIPEAETCPPIDSRTIDQTTSAEILEHVGYDMALRSDGRMHFFKRGLVKWSPLTRMGAALANDPRPATSAKRPTPYGSALDPLDAPATKRDLQNLREELRGPTVRTFYFDERTHTWEKRSS